MTSKLDELLENYVQCYASYEYANGERERLRTEDQPSKAKQGIKKLFIEIVERAITTDGIKKEIQKL